VVKGMRDPPLDVIEVRGEVATILVCAVPSLVRVVEAEDSDHRPNVLRRRPIRVRQRRAKITELLVAIPNDLAGPTTDRAWQPARRWHIVRIQLPGKGRKRVRGHKALCRMRSLRSRRLAFVSRVMGLFSTPSMPKLAECAATIVETNGRRS
jgi:hypothetical protein